MPSTGDVLVSSRMAYDNATVVGYGLPTRATSLVVLSCHANIVEPVGAEVPVKGM